MGVAPPSPAGGRPVSRQADVMCRDYAFAPSPSDGLYRAKVLVDTDAYYGILGVGAGTLYQHLLDVGVINACDLLATSPSFPGVFLRAESVRRPDPVLRLALAELANQQLGGCLSIVPCDPYSAHLCCHRHPAPTSNRPRIYPAMFKLYFLLMTMLIFAALLLVGVAKVRGSAAPS